MESELDLAFRPFAAGDLPMLEAWLADAGLWTPVRVPRGRLLERLLEDRRILVLTATSAQRPVGFVRLDLAPDRTAELTVIVDPGLRRRGIGRQLLARALDEARARGLRRVLAVVSTDNARGLEFFVDGGFAATGVDLPGFDQLERFVHRSDCQMPLEIVP